MRDCGKKKKKMLLFLSEVDIRSVVPNLYWYITILNEFDYLGENSKEMKSF